MSYPGATIVDMKTLARISALVLAMAVCCLGSHGPSMWCALITGAAALGVLFAAARRLGYFRASVEDRSSAGVVPLTGAGTPPARGDSLPRTAVRGR